MLGLMQDRPLLISAILEHAARNHPASKIVSARADGSLARHTWPQVAARAAQLAHALAGRGRRAGRAHRHPGLERPPAPGGLLRHLVHGRGAAHGEPAPVPRPDRLHPGRRAGHAPVRRPDPAAGAGGPGGPAAALAPRRGGDGGGGAAPGRHQARGAGGDAGAGGADRRPAGALRLAGPRRAERVLALLHLGHDGRAEGRALQPPLHRAARARHPAEGRVQHRRVGRGDAGGADVPRQRLGHPLQRRHGGSEPGAAGAEARPGQPAPAVRGGARHLLGRRAHHLDRAAAMAAGRPVAALRPSAAARRRRHGLAAGHQRRVPQGVRGEHPARLGHDGDEPARHHQRPQAGERGLGPRPLPRLRAQAGPRAVLRRDAGAGRRRRADPAGRRRPSASWRSAAHGSPAPTSTARTTRPSRRMAGSAPATW